MVEKFKQLSLIVLLVEIIFSSDLYAQSFKEKLKEYNLTLMEFLPLSLEEVFMFENGGEANV